MGAYICLECDKMFCSHSVNCYPHKDGLVCEDCHYDMEEEVIDA